MNHFGSTFILCFLGFLFIQANAIASWKTCSAHSDCQATGEFCLVDDVNRCSWCSAAEAGKSSSIDGSVPTWCSDYLKFYPAASTTLTSSTVLTYVKQAGWENDVSLCPSFDACTKNCRKEYSVEKTTTQVTLTSTFTDTTDCVCDKVVFAISNGDEWTSASTNFGTVADTVLFWQYSTGALDINVWQDNADPKTVDCVWEYSIGTSSSPAATLTGLFGLISASLVAFVLV
jgi:hypothetical protein